MSQRTTQILLLLLVLGVWGLLLRPATTPIPVRAQDGGGNSSRLVSTSTGLYYYTAGGFIFRFSPDLTLLDRAVPTLQATGMPGQNSASYTVVHERPTLRNR